MEPEASASQEESESSQKAAVIIPKAGKGAKNNALIEEIKQRELRNETKSRVLTDLKVDRDCEIKGVSIFEDYSCLLQQEDISYNEDKHTRYLVIQLLERADGKKWQLWTKQGKLASDNFHTAVKDYFDKYLAILEFEQLFLKKTSNKWTDRHIFQQKAGMYMLIRKESEKEMVAKYSQLERDILKLIAQGKPLSESKLVRSEAVAAVVRDAWNIDLQKQVMASSEMNLDVERLPLGRLQRDQIVKCYKILNSIAKIILSQDKGKQEGIINSLSMDFY